MDKRRTDRVPTIQDIADSIEQICGDDEITSKIVLKYITSLNTALQNGGPFESFIDPSTISSYFWPYGPPPDINIQSTPKQVEPFISRRHTIKDNTLPILNKMQQEMGRKLLQQDLIVIGKMISSELSIPLKKKTRQSKARILEWIASNYDAIDPVLLSFVQRFRESQA
ncbi:hypothetical protein TRFO_35451 [Tritrichomonas foetus]|uniref:Uncharacterized protein n=1 Tax=Tritrichomonas foetus TaxID=1144522 RepID=A0A1J4JKX2_9EUKA|nr:hypothetical protein TRFO_35451 [Tritrichomonas foetus]|eukprot:OHS98213.1 hypothetical protein TRFO_35451 [Tritrichomonas foetus]